MSNPKKRICLFGTSANPPTGRGGHVGIVSYLVSEKLFDEVRVLPVYKHMFSQKSADFVSFEHRLAMCRIAFDGISNVTVSDQERSCFEWIAKKKGIITEEDKSRLKVGTADLLDMILEENGKQGEAGPYLELTLALGVDTFMDLTNFKWRRSKDIIRMTGGRITVFRRKEGVNSSASEIVTEDDLQDKIKFIENEFANDIEGINQKIRLIHVPSLSGVSSSLVRTSHDKSFLEQALMPGVVDYIKTNRLFNSQSVSDVCC